MQTYTTPRIMLIGANGLVSLNRELPADGFEAARPLIEYVKAIQSSGTTMVMVPAGGRPEGHWWGHVVRAGLSV